MSSQIKAVYCYLFYSSTSNSFQLSLFPELDISCSKLHRILLCVLSQSSLVTSAVSSTGLLTHAQTFLLDLDFVCFCLHFWESVNNWCCGNQCPFTLSWLLMDRLVHSLLLKSPCFSKLRCSSISSPLHWYTLSLLAFCHLTISSWKETRTAETLKMQVSHRFIQSQCLLLFYFYYFLKFLIVYLLLWLIMNTDLILSWIYSIPFLLNHNCQFRTYLHIFEV